MLAAALTLTAAFAADPLRFYVGTYTGGKSEGIYKAEFDPATGKIANVRVAAHVKNPSFLALHPNGQFAYAVAEVGGGAVMSFKIDAGTGMLTPLNHQRVGNGPCHISLTPDGNAALVACYGEGIVSSFPVGADGTLGAVVSKIQHVGSGPNKGRQEKPHAHSINPDAAGKFAFAADLGADKVFVYCLGAGGKLDPQPSAKVAPGAGPRHFCFHPNGKHAYVINELANTVTAFDYDGAGGLKQIADIATLPADFKGQSYTAEVVAHRNGKFLYGSNRRHDSIAAFKLDPATGVPTLLGVQGEGIKEPRNFVIDPTGQWLLVGNQNADSIAVFKIDQETGLLSPAGAPFPCPKPVCLRFAAK